MLSTREIRQVDFSAELFLILGIIQFHFKNMFYHFPKICPEKSIFFYFFIMEIINYRVIQSWFLFIREQ